MTAAQKDVAPGATDPRQALWKRRRDEIAALYLEGVPVNEIAERLGFSGKNALNVALHRMRHRYGYDLPYRYDGHAAVRLRACIDCGADTTGKRCVRCHCTYASHIRYSRRQRDPSGVSA